MYYMSPCVNIMTAIIAAYRYDLFFIAIVVLCHCALYVIIGQYGNCY